MLKEIYLLMENKKTDIWLFTLLNVNDD